MVTFLNPEAERLLGWKSEDLAGRELHALTHHHHPDGAPYAAGECPSNEVLRSGMRRDVERDMFLCRDGSFLPVSYVTAPIREGDRIVAAVIAFQDITMRQLVEEERERLIEELKEALENVKTLKGLLPICASCKRIRDDTGVLERDRGVCARPYGRRVQPRALPGLRGQAVPRLLQG